MQISTLLTAHAAPDVLYKRNVEDCRFAWRAICRSCMEDVSHGLVSVLRHQLDSAKPW